MHKNLSSSHLKASSPSSSNDSLHSVNSHTDTSDEPRKTLIKESNFLAFAVYQGLSRYVQQVLHDRKGPLESDTASYLLYCAVHSPFPNLLPNIMRELLKQAGNPNLVDPCLKITTWSAFLVHMNDMLCAYGLGYSEKWGEDDLRRAYIETTVVFVEKGANLHFTCKVKTIIHLSRVYLLNIDLSPRAAIELCLKDLPEYSYLGELCANKGALYYSRCT